MSRVVPESPAGSDEYYSETEESDVEEQSNNQSTNQSDPDHSPVTGDLDDSELESEDESTKSTKPPEAQPTNQNYSQYMAKNRSRYTYSPDPASPVKKPANRAVNQSNHSTPTRPTAIQTLNSNRPGSQPISAANDHSDEGSDAQSGDDDEHSDEHSDDDRSPQLTVQSSLNQLLNQTISQSNLQIQLVKAQALIAERENDIKLAAQIGETLMEENERLEDMIIQLKDDLIKREESEELLNRQLHDVKTVCDDLRHQLEEQSLSQAKQAKALPSPTSTSSVQDFLRHELSASASNNQSINQSNDYHDEYTGDLTADIRSFTRRLNAERRSHTHLVKTLNEKIARLEDDLVSKQSELKQSMSQCEMNRSRADASAAQLAEISEKHRQADMEALNDRSKELIALKKSNERIVAELEHQLMEERMEREQSKLINQSINQKFEETEEVMMKQIDALRQQVAELQNQLGTQKNQLVDVSNERNMLANRVTELTSSQSIFESINPASSSIKKKTKKKRESSRQSTIQSTDSEANDSISQSINPTDDDEQSQLLKQLHNNISDVRQQLTQFRVDEEKKGDDRPSSRNDRAMTPSTEQSALSEREQMKARAKEKRAREKAAMDAARIEAQLRADQIERERQEALGRSISQSTNQSTDSVDQSTYQSTNQSSNQSTSQSSNDQPESINRSDSNVSSMTGEANEFSLSSSSTFMQPINQSVPQSVPPTPSSAINPTLLIPGSSTFTATPSFDRPAFEWSALDHFTLTHIHLLLSQMWSIALSLLTCSPDATPAWIDDKLPACLLCHSKFSFRNRRHHCRLCGGLFCAACSNHKIDVEKFAYKSARACNTCFVVASTVVLCRKAVETGQVEYAEIVREAEKFAASERAKAANVVKPKQLRALESANGSLSYQLVSPRSENGSPTLSSSHTPITPALVPFYEPTNTAPNTPDRNQRFKDRMQAEKDKQDEMNKH